MGAKTIIKQGSTQTLKVHFEPVSAADLHSAWPQVLGGLFKLHQRGSTAWWPEDVYAAVKYGQAFLFRGFLEDGSYAGFVVLVPQTDPYTNQRTLLIWICHATRIGKNLVESSLDELRRLARRGGFESLVFYSPRRGWQRRISGIVVGDTQYEVKV